MIRFSFSICDLDGSGMIHPFYWSKKITENKYLELEYYQTETPISILEMKLDTHFRGSDHAGPRFSIALWKWYFIISCYDNRHWDDEKNSWIES